MDIQRRDTKADGRRVVATRTANSFNSTSHVEGRSSGGHLNTSLLGAWEGKSQAKQPEATGTCEEGLSQDFGQHPSVSSSPSAAAKIAASVLASRSCRPPLAPQLWGLTQQQEVLALLSLSPLETLPAAQGLVTFPSPCAFKHCE